MARWMGIFLVCGAAVLLQAQLGNAGASPSSQVTVRVRQGDTLWGVGRRLTPPSGDVRATVERLRAENDLEGRRTLLAGTTLRLGGGAVASAGTP